MILNTNNLIAPNAYGFITKVDDGWALSNDKKEPLNLTFPNTDAMSVLGRSEYRILGLDDGTSRVIRFSDLHRHSDNSLQDGMTKVPDMVAHTEYSGALTDHGNMYGFLEYYKGMNAAGKKPIIGFEGYMETTPGALDRRHVILLAKNNQGYKNLLKLTSESFDHFKMKPHVTWDMLEQYHEGVICLSACLAGAIPTALSKGDTALAKILIERFIGIFGKEDFYIEIQRHHIDEEDIIRPKLVQLAEEYGLKIVATTDAHYPKPEDREAHDVLLCLQTGKTINDENRLRYNGDGYFLHTSEQMEKLFSDFPQALDNTLEIADKCHVEIKLGDVNLPKYDIPAPFKNSEEYMVHIATEGFHKRFDGTPMEHSEEYKERFDYEIKMIKQMEFPGYFIIVWDFINWAKTHNIYVGPGRGSAAGSMVAYCMGITDLDPIKYNLLFERFLNPERVSYPDIDTDIEHVRRPEVIQYMIQKYGALNVCRIVTFGTFAAKQSIKDVARVLEHPASYGAMLSSYIPEGVGVTIDSAMKDSPDLKNAYENDEDAKRVIDIAKRIEGGKRHASQHACGLCVAPTAVSDYLPTSMEIDEETGEKALTSQVIMTEVEELSLIKMDLLGLKNMSVIHEVIDKAIAHYGEENLLRQIGSTKNHFTYQDIPLNDRATYKMLRDGVTGGVFQMESPGMTKVITQMMSDLDTLDDSQLEECFDRLIAAVALYRPGPMDYIPNYIDGMQNPSHIHYLVPQLEGLLSNTYGVIVFQEQVMQIVQKLAGYSLGRADVVRKAMGKKKKKIMEQEQLVFLHGNKAAFEAGKDAKYAPGCIENGIPEKTAKDIWGQMEKFASYAFNKSHAACYAYLAYITAYMSCHWPAEFYAAMMNAFIEVSNKFKEYLAQADSRGISLQIPDIQRSECHFLGEGDHILFGLQGISGLKSMATKIVDERDKHGPFLGIQDMYERMGNREEPLNKKCIEGLVYSGALNCFSENKAALLAQYSLVEADYKSNASNRAMNQITLFSEEDTKIPLPDTPPLSENYQMDKELEALGMYVSKHPTDLYKEDIAKYLDITPLEKLVTFTVPLKYIKTVGLVKNIKRFYTKAGKEMASFTVETKYASMNCVIFPDFVQDNKPLLIENTVYCIEGGLIKDNRSDALQISVKTLVTPDFILKGPSEAIRVPVRNRYEQDQIVWYVDTHPGNVPVILVAAGRDFPLKKRVAQGQDTMNFFRQFQN